MGCFLSCYRGRDERSRNSHSTCSKYTEPVVYKNRLSNLFLSEDKENSSGSDEENIALESQQIDKCLKEEATFLKACGAIAETPVEIRKASKKVNCDKDSELSNFQLWPYNRSIKNLVLDQESDQPCSPVELCEEQGRETVSSFASCMTDVQRIGRTAERCDAGTDIQCRTKSVRFDCDFDSSSSKSSSLGHVSQGTKINTPCNQRLPKACPNPTPLKLSEEMQTPGTVFPTDLNALASKNMRIRSQYVHVVRNSVENFNQWTEPIDADSYSHQTPSKLSQPIGQSENLTPESDARSQGVLIGNDLKVESRSSAWLNPPASDYDDSNANVSSASSKSCYIGRTPGDRPIIGMVAAHWKEENSHVTHKWWDGNGIPNSTTKYKEDQRVNYHATPFEERLEKALSEENFISQRKHLEKNPIVFEENDESDTALSTLQAPVHSKTVVSF